MIRKKMKGRKDWMDYKKIVTDKETELGPLFSRMDTDKDLYYGKAFEMKDSNGRLYLKWRM